MAETITLSVARYRPEIEPEPAFQDYRVPYRKDWVVLDALNYIKDNLDGSLSFRWSCRMGVCGSCGMMVNGTPKLTCAAFLSDYLPGPTPEQLDRYKQFSMCLNCLLCYAACPIYGLEGSFVGPAAIALAQRYNLDSRDQGSRDRMETLSEQGGMWECTFVGECTKVCPKKVDPAGAIQQYKVATATEWFKSLLMPWGSK